MAGQPKMHYTDSVTTTPDNSPYTLRTATADEWPAIADVLGGAFNEDFEEDSREAERLVFEPERTVLAVRDDEIAGVAGAFTRDLSVPGGALPASHVTMVSVSATHRRQGLLNRMIAHLHSDAAERGESLAVLWASEGRIYQRYGYGLAARRVVLETSRSADVVFREPAEPDAGRLRAVPTSAVDSFRKIYDQVVGERPGWINRDDRWWSYIVSDPKSSRDGATPLRAVMHDGPDGPDGYMFWRVKGDWNDNGPNGKVWLRELVATTPAAYRALFEFALRVDLTRSVRCWSVAVDEPLQYLVTEPRHLNMKLGDGLWVRILDVPAALSGRRYAAPVDVVIEVNDPAVPANNGRFRLVGDRNTATCTRVDSPADIQADIPALGAAYLGDASLHTLAAGGRVRELRPDTLMPASIAFGWHRAPSATEVF
jgi:predicted acetyltransferase